MVRKVLSVHKVHKDFGVTWDRSQWFRDRRAYRDLKESLDHREHALPFPVPQEHKDR